MPERAVTNTLCGVLCRGVGPFGAKCCDTLTRHVTETIDNHPEGNPYLRPIETGREAGLGDYQAAVQMKAKA